MDKRHLPFREIEPEEGNVVVSISYSGTGHAFLVCTAGSQPKVCKFQLSRTSGLGVLVVYLSLSYTSHFSCDVLLDCDK